MILGNMTWPQVANLDRSTIIILPTASFEQHGPHLPLNTDIEILNALIPKIDPKVKDIAGFLPTLWLGYSLRDNGFDGTITADSNQYLLSIKNTLHSLITQRFHQFIILNSHPANDAPNLVATQDLKSIHPNITISHINLFDTEKPEHAGELETSIMLHIKPELVHMDQATPDGLAPEPHLPNLITNMREITEFGVIGNPTLASADKGKIFLDKKAETISAQIKTFKEGFVFQE